MTNQSDRQADARSSTGTALTYEGDSLAYFDSQSVAAGEYNGRLLAWINSALGTSYTEINGAKTALANAASIPTWDGLNLLGGAGSLGGVTVYDSASVAIFNSFSTPPTVTRKGQIDTLVKALKATGAWAAFSHLYVTAAADSQAGSINWKNPGTDTVSLVSSPTFTADRGFTGNGTSSFLQGPAWTAVTQYTTNSNSLFDWVLNSVIAGNAEFGSDGAGQPTLINAQSTSLNAQARSSNTTSVTVATATGFGFTGAFRTSATDFVFQRNGTQATQTQGVTGTPTGNMVILKTGAAGFTTRQVALAGAGAGISGADALSAYSAFLAYMQAVGAA